MRIRTKIKNMFNKSIWKSNKKLNLFYFYLEMSSFFIFFLVLWYLTDLWIELVCALLFLFAMLLPLIWWLIAYELVEIEFFGNVFIPLTVFKFFKRLYLQSFAFIKSVFQKLFSKSIRKSNNSFKNYKQRLLFILNSINFIGVYIRYFSNNSRTIKNTTCPDCIDSLHRDRIGVIITIIGIALAIIYLILIICTIIYRY